MHQALVVDTAGTVVGLITLEDVLGELLGGVADEFKAPQVRPIRLSDGRLRLPGAMRLEQASPPTCCRPSGGSRNPGKKSSSTAGRSRSRRWTAALSRR